ncbi:MAG: HYC_CC_PP family protein [Flavobacteriaceae bacterium]
MVNTNNKRVVSVLMAFFVIISSFSFKIEQRFCGLDQSNFSDSNRLESCCSKDFSHDAKFDLGYNDYILINQPCCSGIDIFLNEQENFQIVSYLDFEFPVFNSVLSNQKKFDINNFEDKSELHYNFCNPPPLIFDILIYNQVFLI